jgi:hypothetical protein
MMAKAMFTSAFERHARRIRDCRRGGAHHNWLMPIEVKDDVTSAVSAEQVRTLFRQMPIALSVNFVNAALVAIVLTPLATRPFPLPWFVSVMLVTIGRLHVAAERAKTEKAMPRGGRQRPSRGPPATWGARQFVRRYCQYLRAVS